jgi:ABC-type uncharacterized transport system auxiliary subunit
MKSLLSLAAVLLSGCVSIGVGGESAAQVQLTLHDAAITTVVRRAEPLANALLVQPQPANALADTLSIAYSRREHEYAFYQLASWTERPVRQLPRLLVQRLEARGVAAAVGVLGDPMRADWLLTLSVDALHHDLRTAPGVAHLALTAELFDRRTRKRLSHRRFDASTPTERADSSAAAQALSLNVAKAFDQLLPWLEADLQRAATAAR